MIKLSVIIVSFNTKELLMVLLKSLKKAINRMEKQGFKTETIIVDNNSQDGSPELVKKRYRWIKLIQNPKNVGFAAGTNRGILNSKGEYLLLLNSDTQVFPETLTKIIKFMESKPKVAAITCRVELPNGKVDPASHRGFPTPWNAFCYFLGLEKLFPKNKLFAGYHQGWKDLTKKHQIDAISGSCFLVRRSVVDKVGLLDDRFFMYGEDLDWCYRIKKAGFQIYYYPHTKIIHYKGQSGVKKVIDKKISKGISKEIKKTAKRNFYETMKLFYQKHYQEKYLKIVYHLVLLGIWFLSKFRK